MRRFSYLFAFVALITVGFSSCKVFKGASVNCTPDPIEVHADSIRFQLKASVPPKSGMKKGGTYSGEGKIGGVSVGKIVFSTEKYPNVKKTGIDTTIKFARPYQDKMNGNSLLINQDYERKGKTFELPDVENLCECCITTSRLVYEGTYLLYSEHNYVKEVKAERRAQFDFPKNVFEIQPANYSKSDIVAIGDFLKNKYITKEIVIEGFASPEGPYQRNIELSTNRSQEVKKWLIKQLQDAGYTQYVDTNFFKISVTHEDWKNFQSTLQSQPYSEEIKKQIATIVSSGDELDVKERKVMELVGNKEKVEHLLAPLRRATIFMNGFEMRRTDAQIDSIAQAFIDGKLSGNLKDIFQQEEWLYAISRQGKPNKKKPLLEAYRDAYATDFRAFNDLGVIALIEGDNEAGMNYLDKAAKLNSKDAAIQNNVGVAYIKNGKYKEAKSALESSLAAGSSAEANFNLGVVLEKMARYNMAVEKFNAASSLGGAAYNAGLCKLLMGDVNGAKTSLNDAIAKSGDVDAMPYYVLAVAGARSKDASLLTINLRKAVKIDSKLKDKALKDLEFKNYFNNTEFKAAIGG
jgi:outer membrane protein OmpA-like peptidoglycan-associated protein